MEWIVLDRNDWSRSNMDAVTCLNSLCYSPVSSDFLVWCGFATKTAANHAGNMTKRSVNGVFNTYIKRMIILSLTWTQMLQLYLRGYYIVVLKDGDGSGAFPFYPSLPL